MTQRESYQLWMRDVLEHLRESLEQLEWTTEGEMARVLVEGMKRDLDCAQRLCEAIRARLPGQRQRGKSTPLVSG